MSTSFPVELDKDSAVPLYYQLQQSIIDLIDKGTLQPGQGIPSENVLSRRYNISPMTVRQAMTELAARGYVRRERGRGTFIAARQLTHSLERPVGFSEDMRARGVQPGSKVLLLEVVPAPEKVALESGIPTGMPLLRLRRLRFADDQPVGVHDSYLSDTGITLADFERMPSLYDLLAERGQRVTESDDCLEAASADRDTAELLDLAVGAPLLRVTRISRAAEGRFVEHVEALYRAELYQYRVHLRR
jgi:GntR family transcriptional regulator